MKRQLILAFGILLLQVASAQSIDEALQFGLQASPTISWINTNDNRIARTNSNTGNRIGIFGQKLLNENYGFVGALSFALDQGGTLEYLKGGNFLPKSDLSNPEWNRGDKPLPDDVEIAYHITFLEVMAGFKLRTNQLGKKLRIYTEFPTLSLSLATSSKGDINGSGIDTEDEAIGPDLKNLLLSWGAGIGVELSLGESLVLVPGVSFQQSLIDVTRDKGHVAIELQDDMGTTDPTDDIYQKQSEDSKGKLGSLSFRIAVLF